MRWFVRGDVDGFFGLALDNLVQLLVIVGLCGGVLGFPAELLYGAILPGVAISLLVGNLYYAWQAKRLAEATGRTDVCALPYGINTVSLFAHVFLVMLPVKLQALDPVEKGGFGLDPDAASRLSWQVGLLACLGSGVIEFAGAFVAERLRKATPRAALLSTLAGIALSFISLTFLFRTFAAPVVGFTTLGIILLIYFGGVKFRGGLPGGMVAVAVGTLLAWTTGLTTAENMPQAGIAFHAPVPYFGDVFHVLGSKFLFTYLSIIIPMGVFNVVGSLQNIESAEAAGDSYPTQPSLMVNGIGSIAAAFFGSCFPTTIYIGHPGWKGLGARAGYSILNAVFMTAVCVTGAVAYIAWAVPIEAGMAIVLWIGMVITAQAFQATERKHAPAAVVGLLVGVGAWGSLMLKNGLRAMAEVSGRSGVSWDDIKDQLLATLARGDTYVHGAFSLEQGMIFSAMILSAATVFVIEKQFTRAAAWCVAGAALSAVGLMHTYAWGFADTVQDLNPHWPWAVPAANMWAMGYLAMGLCFFLANWLTVKGESH
ncbi:MAG: NCS2 family permease [Planctomycetes bacterium]|nr:NCS2 family permease [Planctomycetota bacterium]